MRRVRFFTFLICSLGVAACGAGGNSPKAITGAENLPERPFFSHKMPVSTGMGTYWVTFNGEGSNGGNVVSEEGATTEASAQVLLTGRVRNNEFSGGQFHLQLKGTQTCNGEVCADATGVSLASQVLKNPGFFNLVAPKVDQSTYLIATFTPDSGESKNQEIYLGVLASRTDHLDFDFSESKADPDPDPPPPGGKFGGPTDLKARD